MHRYKCDKCGGNCDAGELIGGICPECLEEEGMAISLQEKVVMQLCPPFGQQSPLVFTNGKEVRSVW